MIYFPHFEVLIQDNQQFVITTSEKDVCLSTEGWYKQIAIQSEQEGKDFIRKYVPEHVTLTERKNKCEIRIRRKRRSYHTQEVLRVRRMGRACRWMPRTGRLSRSSAWRNIMNKHRELIKENLDLLEEYLVWVEETLQKHITGIEGYQRATEMIDRTKAVIGYDVAALNEGREGE